MKKICTKCKNELNINIFQKITVGDRAYIRHQCIPCRGKQDRQVRLKKRYKNNYVDVVRCECGVYVKSKYGDKRQCKECRKKTRGY